MHRRNALPILCASCSHVRSIATASKPKPTPWPESDTRPNSLRWTSPLESQLAFPASNIKKWTIPSSPNPANPSSRPISSSLDVNPFDLAARSTLPPITPSSSKQVSPASGPGRWVKKISLDPPSGGLTKWATQNARGTALHSQSAERGPKRDLAPHQDPSIMFKKSRRRAPFPGIGSRRENPLLRTAPGVEPRRERDRREREPDQETRTQKPRHSFESVMTPWTANTRGGRPLRGAFKDRGSLASRISEIVASPTHSRTSSPRSKIDANARPRKTLREKKVTLDAYIPSTVSVGTLAKLLNVRLEKLQRKMVEAGMGTEASYDHILTSDYAILLAEEFGRNPVVNDEAAFDIYPSPPHPNPSSLPTRPPIVTIMGHVDHGKTTLLDNLRSASVAKGEAGGITQHIGAFSVPVPSASSDSGGPQSITFLDTPGHAAFSAMRARGARVTDIVVLVVAADDGVMPQTREVIKLMKKDEGKINLVVAINKVDKPGVNIDKIQNALLSENVQLEVFGGDIPSVAVSGLTGLGLNDLVETLSAMAEVQDLRAERTGPVHGYILESKVHKGLGPVATVLILRGCLNLGSHIISGISHAKVRLMNDSSSANVKAAYPGMAITVSGWKVLPNVGDEVLQGSESDIKKAVANRMRKAEIEATLVDVQAINSQRQLERGRKESSHNVEPVHAKSERKPKELRLVIKGDVSGSVEAVEGALQGIGNKDAVVKVVHTGVGEVSESDVMMAKAAEGMIVAFSVSTPRFVEILAAQNGVPLCSSNIIYRLMDHIKERVIALLPVNVEKRVRGEATVLQLFDISLQAKQTMKVAGCRVTNGILGKTNNVRVARDGVIIFDGSFETMRHMKKDITEVRKGSECGLRLHQFDDLREGDLIQAYQNIESPGVL